MFSTSEVPKPSTIVMTSCEVRQEVHTIGHINKDDDWYVTKGTPLGNQLGGRVINKRERATKKLDESSLT